MTGAGFSNGFRVQGQDTHRGYSSITTGLQTTQIQAPQSLAANNIQVHSLGTKNSGKFLRHRRHYSPLDSLVLSLPFLTQKQRNRKDKQEGKTYIIANPNYSAHCNLRCTQSTQRTLLMHWRGELKPKITPSLPADVANEDLSQKKIICPLYQYMLRHVVLLSLVPFLSFSFPLSLSLSPTVANKKLLYTNKRQEVQATKQMRIHNNSNPSQLLWILDNPMKNQKETRTLTNSGRSAATTLTTTDQI